MSGAVIFGDIQAVNQEAVLKQKKVFIVRLFFFRYKEAGEAERV